MHPSFENIDFCNSKFEIHANGCRLVACTKYAVRAQK